MIKSMWLVRASDFLRYCYRSSPNVLVSDMIVITNTLDVLQGQLKEMLTRVSQRDSSE